MASPGHQFRKAGQHHCRLRVSADAGNDGSLRGLRRRRANCLTPVLLKCHKGIGPPATGTALVADDNFSARYDLDRIAGTFSRPAHKLYGQSYVDKILVLVTAKGGVASAWMLREMAARGMAPKAIVFDRAN